MSYSDFLNPTDAELLEATLNVAGPSESERPGIYAATYNLLCALLGCRFTWSQNEN